MPSSAAALPAIEYYTGNEREKTFYDTGYPRSKRFLNEVLPKELQYTYICVR